MAKATPEENPWARPGGPSSNKSAKKPQTFSDDDFGSAAGMSEQQLATATAGQQKNTLELLREAVQTTKETEELGMATLEELEAQREQLQRIQRKVDEVEAHAERGNFIVKGMTGLFGGIKNAFSKKPELPRQVVMKREAERQAKLEAIEAEIDKRNASRDAKTAAKYGAGATSSGPGGAGSNKAPTDAQLLKGKDPALDARIAEEDAMLDLISKNLTNIKAIGVAMGDELTRQDVLLDDLSTSMDRAGAKIDHVKAQADKLAK